MHFPCLAPDTFHPWPDAANEERTGTSAVLTSGAGDAAAGLLWVQDSFRGSGDPLRQALHILACSTANRKCVCTGS